MPFQRVPDSAEITIHGDINGQEIITTFNAHKVGGYDQTDLDNLAGAVDAWVGAEFLPNVGVHYLYVNTHVRGMNAAIDLEADNNSSAGPGGDTSGAALPNNAVLSVKRTTGHTGRGARGRVFYPGLRTTDLTDENHVDAAEVNDIQTILNAFRTAIDVAGWVEVIVHRYEEGVPLAVAVIFTVIEYAVVNNVIDSMRRRLPGRGA